MTGCAMERETHSHTRSDREGVWVSEWMEKASKKKDEIRLFGFGSSSSSIWIVDCKCKCLDELCRSFFFCVLRLSFSRRYFFSTLFSFRFSLYAFSLSVRSHFYFTISMLFAPIAILAIVVVTFFSAHTHTQLHTLSVVSFRSPSIFMGFPSLATQLFFCQQFFLHLFCVSSLTPSRARARARTHCGRLSGCEESVVWCKHNLSHYPKRFFLCSFSSSMPYRSFAFSLGDRAVGAICHLPAHA